MALSTSAQWAIILGGIALVWVVPSILVAGVAAGEGFSPSLAVFVVALFIGWPVVLLAVLLLGRESPLVCALRGLAPDEL